MHPELLELRYMEKPEIEIKNKLKLKETKTLILKDQSSHKFEFDYVPISKDRRYCLHVSPNKVIVEIEVLFDGHGRKHYLI